MKIQLSEHFTYKKLLRFVLPSVIMMIFTSVYTVVDGLFVSNYAGKVPFTAINLIYPVISILGAFGFMLGAGGTAIVSKTMGEGKTDKANEYFSMLVYVTLILGAVLSVLGIALMPQLAILLGAEGEILKNAVLYGRIVLLALPFFMLQNVFQSFFVTAEKPKLGLLVMIGAGVTNIFLDALFVAGFGFGAHRRGGCNGAQPDRRRHSSRRLLFPKEYKPPPPRQNEILSKSALKGVHQRLVRAVEQYRRVRGDDPL